MNKKHKICPYYSTHSFLQQFRLKYAPPRERERFGVKGKVVPTLDTLTLVHK